jgi:hypothetical protein
VTHTQATTVSLSDGSKPMSQLNDVDGRAVDCIMQFRTTLQHPPELASASDGDLSDARLKAASDVLDLIGLCPACEPPPQLAQRTLARIESAEPALAGRSAMAGPTDALSA